MEHILVLTTITGSIINVDFYNLPKKKSVKLLLQISTKQSYTSASTYIRMKKKSQCAVPENISKNGIS